MKGPAASPSFDPKAWLQEIKTNRRTQMALLALPLCGGLIYVLLSDDKPKNKRPAARTTTTTGALSEQQLGQLQRLPDLVNLTRAAEMPNEDRTYRDLFVFDGPPPPPPPPAAPLPPPLPPTEAELKARAEQQARQNEENAKPGNLRFLGYMESRTAGRIAAFMKGEEAIQMKVNALANPQWRLVEVTRDHALFQNLKYADLKHKIMATDSEGNARPGQVTNEF